MPGRLKAGLRTQSGAPPAENYFSMPSNSTSKTSVAFGPITGPLAGFAVGEA